MNKIIELGDDLLDLMLYACICLLIGFPAYTLGYAYAVAITFFKAGTKKGR